MERHLASYCLRLFLAWGVSLGCLTLAGEPPLEDHVSSPLGDKKETRADAPLGAETAAQIKAILKQQAVPGGAVTVLRDGRPIYTGLFGKRHLGEDLPVTANTKFRISSNGKAFTAMAVLLLVEQGKLKGGKFKGLDTRLGDILPKARGVYLEGITLRQLLTMTGGLPKYSGADLLTDEGVLEEMRRGHPRFPAGRYYEYSNSAYAILKLVVDTLHRPGGLEGMLQKHILKPLGMENTQIYRVNADGENTSQPGTWAYGYVKDGRGNWVHDEGTNRVIGDGAIWSSIVDMQKWERAWTRSRENGGLISQSLLDEALKPGTRTDGTPVIRWNKGKPKGASAYGFAWNILNDGTTGHAGGTRGYESYVLRMHEGSPRYSVVVLTNHGDVRGKESIGKLAERILAEVRSRK